jgi:hypothetical protein
MRFAIAFGICGLVFVALAIRQADERHAFGWVLVAVEADLATCLLSLSVIYGLNSTGFEVEDILQRGGWSPVVRAILLPYLALGVLVLFVSRWFDREGLLNPLAPGLSIGRLPFPFERAGLRAVGIDAVLNLCWEFPRLSGVDREPGLMTARIPILDGMPPTDRQFIEAVETVERWLAEGRSVLIHCAQGHGRTATIAAAVLVRLGLARDVREALALVKSARPLARPSSPQERALIRYCSGNRPDCSRRLP